MPGWRGRPYSPPTSERPTPAPGALVARTDDQTAATVLSGGDASSRVWSCASRRDRWESPEAVVISRIESLVQELRDDLQYYTEERRIQADSWCASRSVWVPLVAGVLL